MDWLIDQHGRGGQDRKSGVKRAGGSIGWGHSEADRDSRSHSKQRTESEDRVGGSGRKTDRGIVQATSPLNVSTAPSHPSLYQTNESRNDLVLRLLEVCV